MNNELVMVLGMTVVTFIPRYGLMAVLGRIEMPQPLFRALRFVPPAVLAAIVLPGLVLNQTTSELDISLTNSFLIAGIVSGLVAWRTRNLLLTIIIGMATLWIWRLLLMGIA